MSKTEAPIKEVDELPNDVLHPMRGIQYQGVIYVMEEDCRASHDAMGKRHKERVAKLERELTAERERRVRAEAALRNAPTIYADHRDISQWLEEHAAAIAAAKESAAPDSAGRGDP